MLKALITLISMIMLLIPFFSYASNCANIAYQINKDIDKYAQEIQNKNLQWMSLSWLQQKLGRPKIQKMPDNFVQYKWHCPETSDSYIAVFVTAREISRVEGFYSFEAGAAEFAIDLIANGAKQQGTNTPNTSSAPNQVTLQKTCSDLISQIEADNKKYSFSISRSEKLPKLFWMDLSFLAKILGQPQVQTTLEKFYQWDNFSLFRNSSGLKQTVGSLPAGLNNNSIENITRVLGPPKAITYQDLNQYQWTCSDNHINASLTFFTDTKGKILTVSGQNCVDNRCNLFQFELGESELKQRFNQLANKSLATSGKV